MNRTATPQRCLFAMALLAVALGAVGCARLTELRMSGSLRDADRAFDRGEYFLAASRYESLYDRWPDTPRRETIWLRRAMALYTLSAYHEAREAFVDYLRDYPGGAHTDTARNYLNKIDTLLSAHNPAHTEALEGARRDLDQLQQLHVRHPHDPAVNYALGNLYWELGDCDEAVRYYFKAQSADAAYQEKRLIRERMMIDEAGEAKPVTPEDLERIERERRPLVVFDTHKYLARDTEDLNIARHRFFNVTGLVRNQSARLLRDVGVEVRFYNTHRQVLDTQTVRIGSMAPGEVRAFRAEAAHYDHLYNIADFQCVPRWER